MIKKGMKHRNIELLTNDNATLSDLRKVIETKLPNIVKSSSKLIFYYAGHGAPNPTNGDAYLIPYDGDPAYLQDTAYQLNRLYDKLGKLPSSNILVLIDACFTGSGGRSVIASGSRSLIRVEKKKYSFPQNLTVVTSSSDNQISTSYPEQKHGLFTYFLLKLIENGNNDIGKVFEYIKINVQEEAKRKNVEQTPTSFPANISGRFIF